MNVKIGFTAKLVSTQVTMPSYPHIGIGMIVITSVVRRGECSEIRGQLKGNTLSEPFAASLSEFAAFNDDIQEKYRSIGLLDDFSNIGNNMIKSLQEV